MITVASLLLSSIAIAQARPQDTPKKAPVAKSVAPTSVNKAAAKGTSKDGLPSFAELVADVTKAHRPKGGKQKITSYRSTIKLTPKGKDEDSITVTLDVMYGDAVERAKGKTMPMMVYKITEDGKDILRGSSHDGVWHKIGDQKAKSLTDRDHQTDRDVIRNHRRLCRVMLRFLDPGAILASLRTTTEVKSTTLWLNRKNPKVATYVVSGFLSGFPVARGKQKIKDERVWMEVWVDKKTALIQAVRVCPMTPAGKPQFNLGELILLGKYRKYEGTKIPLFLEFFEAADLTKKQSKLQIHLDRLELNPALTKHHFAKPKK